MNVTISVRWSVSMTTCLTLGFDWRMHSTEKSVCDKSTWSTRLWLKPILSLKLCASNTYTRRSGQVYS